MKNITLIESTLVHELRNNLNHSTSKEEASTFFFRAAQEMFSQATNGMIQVDEDKLQLQPEKAPYYRLSPEFSRTLDASPAFDEIESLQFHASLSRLAKQAAHRYLHLEKKQKDPETIRRIQSVE